MNDRVTRSIQAELHEPHPLGGLEKRLFRESHGGTRRPVRLELREGQLAIDGVAVPAENCASGYVQPITGGLAQLQLLTESHEPSVRLTLASPALAEGILRDLGIDERRQVVRFLAVRPAALLVGLVLFTFALVAAVTAFTQNAALFVAAFLMLVAAMVAVRMSRFAVLLASDGIVVQGLTGSRLLPYATLEGAEAPDDTAVVLRLTDGNTRTLHFPSERRANDAHLFYLDGRSDLGPAMNDTVARLVEGHLAANRHDGRAST